MRGWRVVTDTDRCSGNVPSLSRRRMRVDLPLPLGPDIIIRGARGIRVRSRRLRFSARRKKSLAKSHTLRALNHKRLLDVLNQLTNLLQRSLDLDHLLGNL